MKISAVTSRLVRRIDDHRSLSGGIAAALVAAVVLSRVGIDGFLFRDESIYAYSGQQFAHNVPPYVSTLDPKGPAASFLCGAAALLAHLVGVDDVLTMRVAFFVCAVLTAVAIYLLVLQVWRSPLAAFTSAVVFACFRGYAQDALRGPDAHTLGPLFAVGAMWFALRRQWFWAAFIASTAALVKQTYGMYGLVIVVAAVLFSPEQRLKAFLRALLGTVVPIALTVGYFAVEGALRPFYESAIAFAFTGLHRAVSLTVPERLALIAGVVSHAYQFSGILFWLGTALLIAVAVVVWVTWRGPRLRAPWLPTMFVIGLTMLGQWIYTSLDFISYDDLYQLLPYAAIGFGAAIALGVPRFRAALQARIRVGVAVAVTALVVLSCIWLTRDPKNDTRLINQRAMGCALNSIIPPHTELLALGDPTPLVLTHRRNPNRYIYLESGVARWKVEHTVGGFHGWAEQVTEPEISAIALNAWKGDLVPRMKKAIKRAGFEPRWVGTWLTFLRPSVLARAAAVGIEPTKRETPLPMRTTNRPYDVQRCPGG